MATYSDVIHGALKLLGVVEAESPITASEAQDGLDSLNDLLTEWENAGILLGYEPSDDVNATLEVPRWAINAIKYNLALNIAAQYSKAVNAVLVRQADNSYRNLVQQTVRIDEVEYPDSLPLGSGNNDYSLTRSRFFKQNSEDNF